MEEILTFLLESPSPLPTRAIPVRPEDLATGRLRVPGDACLLIGLMVCGNAVSWAAARHVPQGYEITCETHPDHRGKGYGAQCVAALGNALLKEGKCPVLYRVSPQNPASIQVARKAGFTLSAAQ